MKTAHELAKEIYEKQEALWDQNIGSEVQYLEAKNAYESTKSQLNALQAQVEMSLIRAPFDGLVDNISVKEGELGVPGYPIIQVVDLSKLKLIADVSETYLPYIKKGQQISVFIPTYPDLDIKVPIHRTSNIINPANRTFEVEVRLNNRNNKIKPNMVATIKINDITIEDVIIIPSNVIKKDIVKTEKGDFKEFIFIVLETDSTITAEKIYVETSHVYNNDAVVSSGLKVGQRVIVEGYNTVSSGTEIKVLN
jgi:RND family efflux transporter MFP subunit